MKAQAATEAAVDTPPRDGEEWPPAGSVATQKRMRILCLAREFPFFPGGHGGNARSFCLLRELAATHDFTIVTSVNTPRQLTAVAALRSLSENLFYYRDAAADAAAASDAPSFPDAPGVRERILASLRKIRSFASLAPYEVRLWGREGFENIRPAVEQALHRGPYDLLQIEYSENAEWADEVPFAGPKVLVVADIRTVASLRRLRTAEGAAARLSALAEALRYRRFERRAYRKFDALVVMSESDRDHMRRLTEHPNILVVPNGVDLDYFRPQGGSAIRDRVVFTATMNHPPNLDGILFFAREVWPRIAARHPTATLDIVGSNPSAAVRELASETIRVTGFVPDTRPYIAAASVYVCPLRFASGTRLKILEAMAMGKAVVATSVGAEGIDCTPGENILLADDPHEMADRVSELLAAPHQATALGDAARRVAAEYSWTKLAVDLDRGYNSLRETYAARQRHAPRIVLNGLFLVPGGTTGGIADYFHHLAHNLLRLDRDTRYVLLANPGNLLEFGHLHAENLEKQVVRQPFLQAALASLIRGTAARVLGRPAPPPRRPPRPEIDAGLVHCVPGYIDPVVAHLPCVLTVADIQHEYHPEFFSREELAARRALFGPSIQQARRIIAISEFTRRTLIERLDVAAEKVSVIHLGVDPRFFVPLDAGAIAAARRRHRLPAEYCIYPANLWPHKNHPRLFDALAALPAARRPHLVLTGSSTRTQTALRDEIRRRDLASHVSWLGYVDENDLHALLTGARLMIFPSLFEGFGMPVAEAMASGCAVACAETTSLPEIAGDAALYFDPTSIDAIAAALERLWNDAALRDSLRAAGRERARRYCWRNTALRTLQLYRQTLTDLYGAASESPGVPA